MSLLKRFAFWLPVMAVIHYIFELLWNPVKDMIFAFDPLLAKIFGLLDSNGFLYDNEHFKILFPGFLVHFFLWLIYGVIIDYIIKVLFRENRKDE
ncbi:hypothetical protein PGH26_12530 [Sporosarcina jeotgali]|uniref:Uncharacterized protein n=1 Tax=Sporosarcina jeotgali TaxID=3020056 RepID=A0ABZ0KW91_9BACL|nr:hypothetical protein [Sporosarcina sp. B2O-1]WOV83696.1 hypothetical protein PGH26_12530 [Sporosarcina sp. B2O-1]